MKASPHALPLEGVVEPFVSEFAAQQRSLDEDFRLRSEDFAPICEELNAKGYRELAEALAPSPIVASEMTAEAAFHFSQERAGDFAVSVRVLNLGYRRRFAYEQFNDSSIAVTVRRMPVTKHEPPADGVPSR